MLDDLDVRLLTAIRAIAQWIVPTTTAFLEANELEAASLKDADATVATQSNELDEAKCRLFLIATVPLPDIIERSSRSGR